MLQRRRLVGGPPVWRMAAVLAAAVAWIACGSPAMAAVAARVVNPQDGDIISKLHSPGVYVVNGTCHNAQAVNISVDAGADEAATVTGATWEYFLQLGDLANGDHTIKVTPVSNGTVLGTAVTVTFKIEDAAPGGSISILPSSVVSHVFAGRGAPLADSTKPLRLAIMLRTQSGIAAVPVEGSELSSPLSVVASYKHDLANINNTDFSVSPGIGIPVSFDLGNAAGGLVEGLTRVTAHFTVAGPVNSSDYNRWIIIDATPPVVDTPAAVTFPSGSELAIAGVVHDTGSGIASVEIAITAPDASTETRRARMTFGPQVDSNVEWRATVPTPLAGTYTYSVVVRDNAGNEITSPSGATVIVNKTAPAGAFTTPANGSFLGGVVVPVSGTVTSVLPTFTWTVTANGATIGTGSTTPFTVNWDLTPASVTDGTYKLGLHVVDAQLTASDTSIDVTVDKTAPVVAITAPTGGGIRGTVAVKGTAVDANLAKWELFDGVTLLASDTSGSGTVSYSWDTTSVTGLRNLKLVGTDKAGNVGTVIVHPLVDNTPATATIDVTPKTGAGFVHGAGVIVAGSIGDANAVTWTLSDNGAVLASGSSTGPYSYTWDTTTASEGLHVWTITVTDIAGAVTTASASVTVDNILPVPSIAAPANGAVVGGTVHVTGTVADANPGTWSLFNGATLLQSGAGSAVAYDWNTTSLADGAATLRLVGTDLAGNTAQVQIALTIDNTAPVATIDATPKNGAGFVKGSAITVGGTITEANAVTWTLSDSGNTVTSGAGAGPYGYTWDTTGSTEGAHTWTVTARDAAGNTTSKSVTVKVDNVAPVATITYPAAGSVVGGTVSVTGSVQDANAGPWTLSAGATTVNTGTGSLVTGNWNTIAGADGAVSLKLDTTDLAGNAGSVTVSVTVDNTNPTVSVDIPAKNVDGFVSGTVHVIGSIADANPDTYELYDNGIKVTSVPGTGTSVDYTYNTTAVIDGTHTLKLVAKDKAGHKGEATVTVTVDNTVPVITFLKPLNNDFVRGFVDVLASIVETNLTSWRVLIDGGQIATGAANSVSTTWDTKTVGDGVHAITVSSTDKAGLIGSRTINVTVVNTVPPVTIGIAPKIVRSEGTFIKGSVTVTGSNSTPNPDVWQLFDNGAKVADGTGATATFVWNTDVDGLHTQDGEHTLQVVMFDKSGQSGEARISVIVDNTSPKAFIDAPAAGQFISGAVQFSGRIDDKNPDVWQLLDGSTLIRSGTGPAPQWLFPGTTIAEGSHTFTLKATDMAANAVAPGDVPSVTFIVDRTAPIVTGDVSPKLIDTDWFVSGTVSVLMQMTDANPLSFDLFVDGRKQNSSPLPASTTSVAWNTVGAEGRHTIKIVGTDKAGNTGEWIHDVVVDNLAPAVSITNPQSGGVILVDASHPLDLKGLIVEANLKTSVWTIDSVVTASTHLTSLATGNHTIQLTATDRTNKVGSASLTIHAGPPTATLAAPAGSVLDAQFPGRSFLKGTKPNPSFSVSGTVEHVVRWSLTDTVAGNDKSGATGALGVLTTVGPYAINGEGRHQVSLTGFNTDGVASVPSTANSFDLTLDASAPVLQVTAPVLGTVVPLGSTMTIVFKIENSVGGASDRSPIAMTDGTFTVPTVTALISGPGLSQTYNLARALNPKSTDPFAASNGVASLSGNRDSGFTVTWKIPIEPFSKRALYPGFKYGQSYVITVSGASDIVGNGAAPDSKSFRVGIK